MISSDYHEVDRNVIEILVDHGIDHEDRYGDDAADDDVGNDDDDDDGDDDDDDDDDDDHDDNIMFGDHWLTISKSREQK